jgi:hypothetical protein
VLASLRSEGGEVAFFDCQSLNSRQYASVKNDDESLLQRVSLRDEGDDLPLFPY